MPKPGRPAENRTRIIVGVKKTTAAKIRAKVKPKDRKMNTLGKVVDHQFK